MEGLTTQFVGLPLATFLTVCPNSHPYASEWVPVSFVFMFWLTR